MNKFDQIINEFAQTLTLNKDQIEKKLGPILKGADQQTKGTLNALGEILGDTTENDPQDIDIKNLFDKLIDDNTPDDEKIKIQLQLKEKGILLPDEQQEQESSQTIKPTTNIKTSPTSTTNSTSYKV